MKNTFATLALFAISSTAGLVATTEAAKADAAQCPANATQCPAACNKAVAATAPAPSASTMTKAKEPNQAVEEATAKIAPKA